MERLSSSVAIHAESFNQHTGPSPFSYFFDLASLRAALFALRLFLASPDVLTKSSSVPEGWGLFSNFGGADGKQYDVESPFINPPLSLLTRRRRYLLIGAIFGTNAAMRCTYRCLLCSVPRIGVGKLHADEWS